MKKTKLIIDFEYEFTLFGISSSTKFYKLAWALNNHLNFHLVRSDDYILEDQKAGQHHFGMYTFQEEHGEIDFFKNQCLGPGQAYLLPELIHFDYILKLSGILQSFSKEEMLKELREIKWIEYIADLEVNKLKSKDNFLS
ncbi:MAG: IPExxxVDY family protein [Cytophagales bacterium]|nr:IPExxxVDY family protein [Cytophagales bacterium]